MREGGGGRGKKKRERSKRGGGVGKKGDLLGRGLANNGGQSHWSINMGGVSEMKVTSIRRGHKGGGGKLKKKTWKERGAFAEEKGKRIGKPFPSRRWVGA